MLQKIIRIISNISNWRLKPIRFNLRLDIDQEAILSLNQTSHIPCPLYVSKGAELQVGENFRIAKDGIISVRDAGSKITINDHVSIGANCSLSVSSGFLLNIGKGTSIHSNAIFSGEIKIGEDCLFGPSVTLLSTTHNINGRQKIRELDAIYFNEHGHSKNEPIEIGDDCWLGVNSVILPGVKLGKGCVVGANSVVTKNFPDYSIVGGVPAKLLKKRM
ncbi:acyltransferase [Leptospira levettii]|uniref:acyltransferase n=1 Tax=Leptospira levettii TaxID=2023178 RepID=UPI001083CD0E|nr:acyltransferase [Leptospira levettii]TGK97372.1 acyltransferase [Leptospira levettii]TGM35494.1 acyltransferase [Leptospira levettii]TGM65632.1 acyltransferase [Leptospira levettii]